MFIESARKVLPGFVIDAANRDIINQLFYYFTQNSKGNLNLQKGILLCGEVGVGKSKTMEAFKEFVYVAAKRTNAEVKESYIIATANQVSEEWQDTGRVDRYLRNRNSFRGRPFNVCFDDLGMEPIPTTHMGTARNVLEYVLHERYRYFVKEGTRTHITTNLDTDAFAGLYGKATQDRLREMFNIVRWKGESRRC